jgi:hypothetical protein
MFNGETKTISAEDAPVALSNTDIRPLKMRRLRCRDRLNESSMRQMGCRAALQLAQAAAIAPFS